jgi:hypothetical protein
MRRDRKQLEQLEELWEQWRKTIVMTLAFWSQEDEGGGEPPLDIEMSLVPNYEDIWVEVRDPTGQVDFAVATVEYSPAGAETWTTCRNFERCIGAVDSRHIVPIVNGIDGVVLKNTAYDVRVTYDGMEKTVTTTTRDDPAQFTCSTVTSPLSSVSAILGAIASDTEVVVADGDYHFIGANKIVLLSGDTKVRIRAQNPGNVRFHGWQSTGGLTGTWTNVGSGVWSHPVTGSLADKQFAVFHNEALLPPADNLSALQSARAGWTPNGTGSIYVKQTNLAAPASGSVKISDSDNCITITETTEVDIDGIVFEGFLLTDGYADAGGVTPPKTINVFGNNTDWTIQNCTFRNTGILNRSTNNSTLTRFTVQDNLFEDKTRYMWWNAIKNNRPAVGRRNYEGLSGFGFQNDNNEDSQIVVRRNQWRKANSAWIYGDATGNTGTVRPEKPMLALSIYDNISGDPTITIDNVTIDDCIECNGNLPGYSIHHNKLYTGLVVTKTGVMFIGPGWVTNNNLAKFGTIAALEFAPQTKLAIRLQQPQEQTAPTGTLVVAHNTFGYDAAMGYPLLPGSIAGHWAAYETYAGVDHTGVRFHDNIWKIVTSGGASVGVFWMHLMQNSGNSFAPSNDILHDGDIFDLSGPGLELFSNRGGSPQTIAAYNTAAKTGGGSNIDRLTNCLQQDATLGADYLPVTPVAKVAGRPGYGALTNRGSNIALY